jgi:hypothetical protein
MGDLAAVAIGLSLATTLLVALLVWRKRRHRDVAARYFRDVRGIHMDTYRQTKGPDYTRQLGNPPGYVGGTGPPFIG